MFIILKKWKNHIIFLLFELIVLALFNILNSLYNVEFNLLTYNTHFLLILMLTNIINQIYILKIYKVLLGVSIIYLTLIYSLLEIYFQKLNNYHFIVNIFVLFSLIIIILGIRDAIKEKNDLIKKMKQLAFYDPITGLPNKSLLFKRCQIAKDKGCKNKRCIYYELKNKVSIMNNLTVILIDIDDLKLINNNFGRKTGDILLKQVADRLKIILPENNIIFRHITDEFLIILKNIDNIKIVEQITQQILTSISQPFIINNKKVNITCSIGLSMLQDNDNNIDDIIEKADIALYKAKVEGKNQYCIFNENLRYSYINNFKKIYDLKLAVKNDDFIVHYQPKAFTETNEVFGLEALVRWKHPNLGLIYPNDFIPLAEKIGIIKDIDFLVLRKACKQINTWINEGKDPYNITINISPLFFMDIKFIDIIDKIIAEFDIDSSYIGIEITETVAMHNIEKTVKKIEELKKRKINVYLDDFGKGYSSLFYLKNLPIDYLKIDKNFIDGIKINIVDEEIITHINKISSLLGIKVIAEGIETKEQLEFVREKGTYGYQGFLLSKPMPIEELNLYNRNSE